MVNETNLESRCDQCGDYFLTSDMEFSQLYGMMCEDCKEAIHDDMNDEAFSDMTDQQYSDYVDDNDDTYDGYDDDDDSSEDY